jgi:putative nucleotidyltransferase with HDIG domain
MTMAAKDLLSGYVEIYSLPMSFYRINEAINDPQVSMNEIGKMIGDDVGLTARLLRLVNSAFYNFPSRIDTISRAVTLVGTQQLHDLVLSTSVVSIFKGIPPDLVNMDSFWRHGVACGVAARILAKQRKESNVERYFIGGLIHDIGRLIMYIKRVDLSRSLLNRSQLSNELLYLIEKEVFGFDHGEVGYELVSHWNLPETLRELVLNHHQPMASQKYPLETAIIHVADIIAHCAELGSSGEIHVPPLNEKAWELTGLQVSDIPIIMDQLKNQYEIALGTILGKNGHE